MTELDAADEMLEPATFLAVTVNVYCVLFVSPLTTIGLLVPVPVKFPGVDLTV